jgi:6-phosphogluconolactonase
VTLEMGNAICVYQRNASTGGLETLLQTIPSLPLECELQYPENSTAQLLVHPSGRYVYVSNRGHDTIGCFRVDDGTGKLISVGWYSSHGLCPRHFRFSKDGAICIVANQNSHDLYTYRVNMETGELVDTGHSLSVPSPVCVCL